MAVLAVTSGDEGNARGYLDALGGTVQTRLITPCDSPCMPENLMDGVGGLLLTGGPDISPHLYGGLTPPEHEGEYSPELDLLELELLKHALKGDMPVLAICRGMQVLNVAFGGTLIQHLPGHRVESAAGDPAPMSHSIYLSPGSKLAAILGMGGFFRVNSLHHQGLREAQRSPRLLTSAYSLEDGIVEGLESPEHSWVVGVQCHPERQHEVPKTFGNLFAAFGERAEGYHN